MNRNAAFTASSTTTRATFMGLAALLTLSVLVALGQVADHQFDEVLTSARAEGVPLVALDCSAPGARRHG